MLGRHWNPMDDFDEQGSQGQGNVAPAQGQFVPPTSFQAPAQEANPQPQSGFVPPVQTPPTEVHGQPQFVQPNPSPNPNTPQAPVQPQAARPQFQPPITQPGAPQPSQGNSGAPVAFSGVLPEYIEAHFQSAEDQLENINGFDACQAFLEQNREYANKYLNELPPEQHDALTQRYNQFEANLRARMAMV